MFKIIPQTVDKAGIAAAVALTAAALFLPNNASAQTVQCAIAKAPAEHAICNNENLIVLDEQIARMNAVRKVAFTTLPEISNFSKRHQVWERKRNSCGLDFDCIELRYRERINELGSLHLL